jgi:immune inhibitor A
MKARYIWVLIALMVIITMILPTCMPPPPPPRTEAPTEPALTMVSAGSSLYETPSPAATAGQSVPTPTLLPTRTPVPTGAFLSATATPTITKPSPTALTQARPTATPFFVARPPDRDLNEIASRLRPPASTSTAARVQAAVRVGDRSDFWVLSTDISTYYRASARVVYITEHAYMYATDDLSVRPEEYAASADFFEKRTYPTLRQYFGSERSPGIDGASRISILNVKSTGVNGYFSANDESPRTVNSYSNERKMLYINASSSRPGTKAYDGVLAHEFTHMIQSNVTRGGDTWMHEGQAELGANIALGTSAGGFGASYLARPNTQLVEWGDGASAVGPHYGAAYLFLSYFADRFGGYGAVGRLMALGTRGPDAFDHALKEMGIPGSFESVFEDWLVANYVGPSGRSPEYRGYGGLTGRPAATRVTASPYRADDAVAQYGALYYEIPATDGDVVVEFTGAQANVLAGVPPFEGKWEWWSGRGDTVDSRLTREFALPIRDRLTLSFRVWFDTERSYDFCYLEASADGGKTWSILRGQHSSTSNDSGLSFGQAYTGRSGAGQTPGWVEEAVDLTPFVGKTVLLRFEYVTDDAYNADGVGIDTIAMDEIGFFDGAESGDGGWVAEGFVRTRNTFVPRYSVRVFRPGANPDVQTLALDDQNHGVLTIQSGQPGADGIAAVVVIAGETRYTRRPSEFTLSIRRAR